MSPEEYLAAERLSETKHEFVNGEIYAMAGGTREHSLIASNLVRELGTRLRRRPCEVHGSDMRVLVAETGLYTYPDVSVACDGPRFADEEVDTLLNPRVIVEVLSDSTESYDRTVKWAHCRQLESLAEYILVAQDECHVEQFVRRPDGTWVFREYSSLKDSLRLPSLGCRVPLSEIYYQVEVADRAH